MTQQDVFRFDVGVDDFAVSVEVVKALQDLHSMAMTTICMITNQS